MAEKIGIECEADGQTSVGFVHRRRFGIGERYARAFRMFGIWFGVAFVTIFIPVLHFVLPPLFILLGAVFAISSFLEKAEIFEGELSCPNCRAVMRLDREAEEWPKKQRCGGCSYLLEVKPRLADARSI